MFSPKPNLVVGSSYTISSADHASKGALSGFGEDGDDGGARCGFIHTYTPNLNRICVNLHVYSCGLLFHRRPGWL